MVYQYHFILGKVVCEICKVERVSMSVHEQICLSEQTSNNVLVNTLKLFLKSAYMRSEWLELKRDGVHLVKESIIYHLGAL